MDSQNQILDSVQVCDEITGIAVPGGTEQAAQTIFANEACDQVSVRAEHYSRLPEHVTDISSVTNISDYFARPIIFAQGTVNTASFSTHTMDNSVIQNAVYNFARVRGAFGWRATMVFRLQVIATPFQGGRIRMSFSPFQNEDAYAVDRATHIALQSQLPGVELDYTEQTSSVLRVPFIHPYNYFTVKPDVSGTFTEQTLGTLNLYSYLPPTIATGDVLPSYVLWFSLEDLELVGVSPYEYEAQMAPLRKGAGKAPTSAESTAIPGNLSNVLAAGSNLVTWAGSRIPFLSSLAGPTSWALRGAADVAAAFGWAKPLSVAPIGRVIMTNNGYQHNCDGPDIAASLSMFAENNIQVLPGFAGSDVDEMSFDFIKGVYACISRGTISVSTTRGSLIYSCQLSPSALYFRTGHKNIGIDTSIPNADSGLAICPSPVFALANPCRLWRGGFKFRVKIAKTKFHTGRIVLGYIPTLPARNGSTVNIPTDITQLQYTSVIWDLREGNTMEFEVPFCCPQSYVNFDQNVGTFFMSVIEPLHAPDTVSQSCPFVVEVAGAQDFEVAFPAEINFPRAPQDTLYQAQSGLQINSVPADHVDTTCIGERIQSVKQMISRGCLVHVGVSSGLAPISGNDSLPVWLPNATAPTSIVGARYDYFNYFQGFFGLQRGGVAASMISNNASGGLGAFLATKGNYINSAPLVSENRAPLHVKVPYYSKFSRTLVKPNFSGSLPIANLTSTFPAGTVGTSAVFLRAADDFQFGYFLGAPPLAIIFDQSPSPGNYMFDYMTKDHSP